MAEGNPLYAEEITGLLVDDGSLVLKDERWVAVGALSDIPVPATISALLAARLDRLPSDERWLIEVGSVMSKIFYSTAVCEMAGEGADARRGWPWFPRSQTVRASGAPIWLRPTHSGSAIC